MWFQNRRQRQCRGNSGFVLTQASQPTTDISHCLLPLRAQPIMTARAVEVAIPLPDAMQTLSSLSTASTATTGTTTLTATATPTTTLTATATPMVAAHPETSTVPRVAGQAPAQMETCFQAVPPFSILWADDAWLGFCGFELAEVLGRPMSILQRSDNDPFEGPVVGEDTFAWGERMVFGPVLLRMVSFTRSGATVCSLKARPQLTALPPRLGLALQAPGCATHPRRAAASLRARWEAAVRPCGPAEVAEPLCGHPHPGAPFTHDVEVMPLSSSQTVQLFRSRSTNIRLLDLDSDSGSDSELDSPQSGAAQEAYPEGDVPRGVTPEHWSQDNVGSIVVGDSGSEVDPCAWPRVRLPDLTDFN